MSERKLEMKKTMGKYGSATMNDVILDGAVLPLLSCLLLGLSLSCHSLSCLDVVFSDLFCLVLAYMHHYA